MSAAHLRSTLNGVHARQSGTWHGGHAARRTEGRGNGRTAEGGGLARACRRRRRPRVRRRPSRDVLASRPRRSRGARTTVRDGIVTRTTSTTTTTRRGRRPVPRARPEPAGLRPTAAADPRSPRGRRRVAPLGRDTGHPAERGGAPRAGARRAGDGPPDHPPASGHRRAVGTATRDNLALAPQAQPLQRHGARRSRTSAGRRSPPCTPRRTTRHGRSGSGSGTARRSS